MSNEQHHPEHAQEAFLDALFEQSPPNLAALTRACADGELTPEQCERLKQLIGNCPVTPARIAFDEALRGCCRRAMHKPQCPDALRDRIAAMARQSGAASDEADASEQRIESAGAYTSDRSFWARSPVLSIAAVLMLTFAGVLIWQSANLASAFRAGTTLSIEQASYSERIGRFVLGEHTRCCDDEAADAKLVERDIVQAVSYFSEQFQRPVQMPDMQQGEDRIRFYGGGDCHVPETIRSGHLRFDAFDDAGTAISLSLFIAPDPGILPLEEGVTYLVGSEACDAVGARLFVWINNGVQYMLVSEASDETCASVRGLMNAPSNVRRI